MQKSRSLSLQGNTVALGTWQESNQFSYLQNAKSSLSAEREWEGVHGSLKGNKRRLYNLNFCLLGIIKMYDNNNLPFITAFGR